ncbi:MAG: hypothetical protein CM1200mP22_32490 [Dehalococcoidia bacterium]|nr:MAG: hypothetical protein CM1200mP22_32490 [Dehalococcoidia bacterium]
MTTRDPNVDGLIEDAVVEDQVQENPLFLISVDRLAKLERSPVHLVAGRLAIRVRLSRRTLENWVM